MIRGKHYYFFRLDVIEDDPYPEYRVAESYEDLCLRLGHSYVCSMYKVTKLNEVTIDYIRAMHDFIYQQIS